MGKRLKIAVVGLPLFGERYADNLNKFQFDSCTAKYFNSYYKKSDKFRLFLQLKNYDVLVSINGTVSDSKAFDLAMKHQIPIVMNWVGSDVLETRKAINSGVFRQDYIDYATHLCEVNWIQDELSELGIKAEVLNFLHFDSNLQGTFFNKEKLSVISYINKNNPEFYGLNELKWLASKLPDIQFTVAGYDDNDTENISYLGWVANLPKIVNQHQVVLRFTEHDGLSNMVLESLYLERIVLYNNPLNHCKFIESKEQAREFLASLELQTVEMNTSGKKFVEEKFSHKVIYQAQIEMLKNLVNG